MAYTNPFVGTKGKFEFLSPFVAASDTEYTVVAVRSFVELSKNQIDVYSIYYASGGVAKEVFEADSQRGASIISLRDDAGQFLYIPDSFIASAPDIGGVKYERKILSIDLGALPADIDLTNLQEEISDFILGKVGVLSTVSLGTMKSIGIVSQDQHEANEDGRIGRIAHPETALDEAVRLRVENQSITQRYNSLLRLALQNGLITPTT